jgi:K+-dependent Na+/Ca+ exchanger-like protein
MTRKRANVRPPKIVEYLSWAVLALAAISFLSYFLNAPVDGHGRMLRNDLCSAGDDGDDGDDDAACPEGAHPPGMVVLYIIGVLYLFVALAVVCDDFFVPPLESISEMWNMNDDVAGATLMAAGGSAPELATSLIGTFQGSDVGFGTIVGSAVFNVLFVIACCVMFTPPEKSPLELTAWPLARDCTCYIICLISVAFVFGINTVGIIEGWEAAFLFSLYVGYCTIMAYNEDIHEYLVLTFASNKTAVLVDEREADEEGVPQEEIKRRGSAQFYSHFRGSILQMMGRERSIFDTAAIHCIKNIEGDVRTVFDKLDSDKSGTLETKEIKQLLESLLGPDAEATEEHVTAVMKELDVDQNGHVDFAEFTVWYVQSEERLKHEERVHFMEVAGEQGEFIYPKQINMLLHKLEVPHNAEQLEQAINALGGLESEKKITYEEFAHWFEHSDFWKEKQHDAAIAAEAAEGVWGELLDFPKETWQGNAMYLFLAPIAWPLACTAGIRDVRVPGNSGWAFFQFFTSIAWIGGYSYVLVDWAETIGVTIGIPSVVMGLTILAAGTSIPDLLSSIVVAKAGKGDMAVSSSIGSNIFDVTVGLPVPWMLFNIIMDCPVVVGADNLFLSVIVLLGMVAAVVICIKLSNWKMSKGLGISMLVLYFIFLGQDVARVFLTEDIKC